MAGKASELAPENPTIIWLRLQLCAASAGCDIRDAATTMRWVDAENGAAWIATLAAAQKEGDAVEVDRILADMAHGAYFDLYWNRTVVLLFDALKRAGGRLPAHYLPSDVARLLEAMEIASAETIPSLTPLLNACREPAGSERRDLCLRVAKIMQRGDTVVAQLAGFSIERRLTPPDSKEGRERRRAPARFGVARIERKPVRPARAALADQFSRPGARRADARHAAGRGCRHCDTARAQDTAGAAGGASMSRSLQGGASWAASQARM